MNAIKIKPKIISRTAIQTHGSEIQTSHEQQSNNEHTINEDIDLALSEMKAKYSSESYYRTSVALVNRINKHFGWEQGIIPIGQYERHMDDIIKFIIEQYNVKSKESLSAKLSAIMYPLKLVNYDGLLNNRGNLDRFTFSEGEPAHSMQWNEILDILDENIKSCGHPGGKIVAITYKYGYFVSINDIANTKIGTGAGASDDMEHNYLDFDRLSWTIIGDIEKNRLTKSFSVSKEYIDNIRGLIRKGSDWLISKKNGQPYKPPLAFRHLQLSGFTLNEIKAAHALKIDT